MIKDIRKDALSQIIRKAAPRGYHPDSITGISLSTLAAPELDATSIVAHDERENDALAENDSQHSSFEQNNATTFTGIASPDMDGDTDEDEGGISLLGIKEALV
jgi:hypothetical protein